MDDLTSRLHDAADDGGRPLRTDPQALLDRARHRQRSRRRVRVGGAVLGVAAVTAAAVVVPAWLEGGPASDPGGVAAAPRPSGGATATDQATVETDRPLTDREVVSRCEPQLEKYYELPMYARERWQVVHERDYRVGDVVLLGSGRLRYSAGILIPIGSNPVLCVVPEAGEEDVPVPFDRFTPDGDRARLTELCAERSDPYLVDDAGWTDLRGGEVLAVDRAGPTASVLIRADGKDVSCSLSPVTWDAVASEVFPAGRGAIYLRASSTAIKSIVDDAATYYFGAGRVGPEARTLRFGFADGRTAERPVGDGGAWAVMIRLPGSGGVVSGTVDVLDAEGRVLATYDAV